ncbi:MAG: hypothetical protein HYR55_12090 [Acidobacteria bacterium]|nr:hypothetical protein [Acidobacteriota bacterium]MBI3657506.1 hypothetical protein [Acidobacteriota bacterium]
MVVIIVLLMFLALITIDWIRTRKKVKVLEASATSVSEPVSLPHPPSAGGLAEKYYHTGHTWARVAANCPVRALHKIKFNFYAPLAAAKSCSSTWD